MSYGSDMTMRGLADWHSQQAQATRNAPLYFSSEGRRERERQIAFHERAAELCREASTGREEAA